MSDIYHMIHTAQLHNKELAVCIVVGTKGSVPRTTGAKMLVYPGGDIYGTIGGGRVEKKVIEDAQQTLISRRPVLMHYDLLRELNMCCGGSMDIYIEPIVAKNKLYIFGAGHTGLALAKRTAGFDFDITIIDDREEYTGAIDIAGITTMIGAYSDVLPGLTFDDRTFVTIMTYSHPVDRQILAWCIGKPHAYIGMIGSRRKVEVTKRMFEEEQLGSPEQLDEIDMPMGLDIGAEGPDEISISILAKLLSVKNKISAT